VQDGLNLHWQLTGGCEGSLKPIPAFSCLIIKFKRR